MAELEREIADLQARLRRQVLALEEEQTLHLTISYDHREHTAQIEITLAAVGQGDL